MDLTGLLSRLDDRVAGDRLSVGDMVATFEDRGFGPLLLAPALVALLPTGAIPGVPTVCAVLITLVAVQLIVGKRHPWIPRRLRRVSIERAKFNAAYQKVTPITRRIDRIVHPRLLMFTRAPAPRLVAALCLLLAWIMVPLELVPFAAAGPAFAISFLALGLSVRDGLMVVVGIVCATVALIGGVLWGL